MSINHYKLISKKPSNNLTEKAFKQAPNDGENQIGKLFKSNYSWICLALTIIGVFMLVGIFIWFMKKRRANRLQQPVCSPQPVCSLNHQKIKQYKLSFYISVFFLILPIKKDD